MLSRYVHIRSLQCVKITYKFTERFSRNRGFCRGTFFLAAPCTYWWILDNCSADFSYRSAFTWNYAMVFSIRKGAKGLPVYEKSLMICLAVLTQITSVTDRRAETL